MSCVWRSTGIICIYQQLLQQVMAVSDAGLIQGNRHNGAVLKQHQDNVGYGNTRNMSYSMNPETLTREHINLISLQFNFYYTLQCFFVSGSLQFNKVAYNIGIK